jgi:branched-chain amino acid transport system ATP-binding protein
MTTLPNTEAPLAIPEPANGRTPVLEAKGVSVRYGSLLALNEFNFQAFSGQVTAVIGPNGSGKTTFLNALTGLVPYKGNVIVNGEDMTGATPPQMYRRGVARTFQNLDLIDDLTVEANVALGGSSTVTATVLESVLGAPRARRERRERAQSADAALALLSLEPIRLAKTKILPYGLRRRAEVARAIASGPKTLLLDEPTAGMGPSESEEFGMLLMHLANELKMGVVIIEHDMSVVRSCATEVYVLATGNMIAQGPPNEVLSSEVVRNVYLGETGD